KQKNFASRKIGSLCGGWRKPAPALFLYPPVRPAALFVISPPWGPSAGTKTMRGPAFASPRRGTLSFVTQSSFVLVRSTTEGTLVGYSFLLSHRMGVYPGLQTVSRHLQAPYIKYSMVPYI